MQTTTKTLTGELPWRFHLGMSHGVGFAVTRQRSRTPAINLIG
jgi:hypothetical protein